MAWNYKLINTSWTSPFPIWHCPNHCVQGNTRYSSQNHDNKPSTHTHTHNQGTGEPLPHWIYNTNDIPYIHSLGCKQENPHTPYFDLPPHHLLYFSTPSRRCKFLTWLCYTSFLLCEERKPKEKGKREMQLRRKRKTPSYRHQSWSP